MISFERNFIFIHIPKTGGNSIQKSLRSYTSDKFIPADDSKGLDGDFGVRNEEAETTKHSSLREYKNGLSKQRYESMFTFSVLRNPWDRVASHYFSPHRGIDKWNKSDFKSVIKETRTARSYLAEYNVYQNKLLEEVTKLLVHVPLLYSPMSYSVDFVMKYENLQEDFDQVCDFLGLGRHELPHTNKSGKGEYRKYYDKDTKNMVLNKFREEIEFFNYKF